MNKNLTAKLNEALTLIKDDATPVAHKVRSKLAGALEILKEQPEPAPAPAAPALGFMDK